MKKLGILATPLVLLLAATLLTGCMTMTPVRTVTRVSYENPQWAPPYYEGARYYYVPDLELYYDLATREYIFLNNGRWYFSPYLPSIYSDYNLADCFCVVLNVQVYRPWLHHQYYLTHYPRYYYRDYYDHSGIPYVRAYNENQRRAIYWNANERHRARAWDDENVRDNRRFRYSKDDRKEQKNQTRQSSTTFGGGQRGNQQNDQGDRPSTRPESTNQNKPATTQTRTEKPTRSDNSNRTTTTTPTRQANTSQPSEDARNNRTNYYGRNIGNSVKVTRQMKDNTPAQPARTPAPATRSSRQSEPTR